MNSLKIVNEVSFHEGRAKFVFKALVSWMGPIHFTGLPGFEDRCERDLVAAFHDRPTVSHHAADVKDQRARNRLQVRFGSSDELIHGVRIFIFRPENYDMRKHSEEIAAQARLIKAGRQWRFQS